MTALRAWFDGRSLRERRLLIAMLALAALTLAWAGVIRPVDDRLASARTRHADAVIRLGETRALVDAARLIQRGGAGRLIAPIADEVRARAAEAGFTLLSVDLDGPDRVRVAVQSARPGALAGWLARLEARGLLVDSAAFTPNPDRTVGATLTLRSRAQ
ncbi:type II secretion system protein GspM [uncultured Sphingomonas sp.]|uniref:type II secretion system protein GspM n=1 Tax=uncultured Sphingomonas sp. TaxID=158754 RepID=UPI0035CA8AD0